MNFGIIGSGVIADFHAQAIHAIEGSKLIGVYNRSAEKADTFAQKHACTAFSSLEAMLAHPDLDIVTIATPSGAHLEPALAAINAGKHVLIEKPLEITTERIDQIEQAAQAKGVTVAAILNRRFNAAMDAFKSASDAGRFGTLTSASAYIKWYRDQAYYDSGAWRGTWELDGGGALMNQGIHTVDALIYLAGPVKSVQASTACLAHENIEVEDIVVALIEFESGARGVIEASTCSWSAGGHPARIQIAGTAGSVFLADEQFEVWEFQNETPADAAIRQNHSKTSSAGLGANDPKAINFIQHQRNFESVIASIKAGKAPSTHIGEARKSVELIQAIYKSAQNQGQKVTL